MNQFDTERVFLQFFHSRLINNYSFWSKRKGTKTLFYLRNIAIEDTVRHYISTEPLDLYTGRYKIDRCNDIYRANHYGVSIGDVISRKPIPRSDYISRLARFKRHVRSISKNVSIVDEFNLLKRIDCIKA